MERGVTSSPANGAGTAAEVPPVALGYASGVPQARPPKGVVAAAAALAMGLVLLSLACYVLLKLIGWRVTGGLDGSQPDLLVLMAGAFGFFCTFVATVFLFVGLRWLGGIARAGG